MKDCIDAHTHIGVEIFKYLRTEYSYAQDWNTLMERMDHNGVKRSIVFSTVTYQAMDFIELRKGNVVLGNPLDDVPYQHENERLMIEIYDLFSESASRAIPFVIADPLRKVADQVKCLEKLRQRYRFYGIKIQPTMIQSPILSLLKEGSSLLAFAKEYDLPFLIHSSILPKDSFSQASDILKIAEKNPELRFCVAHSARFHKPSLDRIRQMPNVWYDCSAHGIHCQAAVQESPIIAIKTERFDSDYTKPGKVLADMAETYPNKLMWGTDAPAYSYISSYGGTKVSLVSTYQKEVEYLHAVPEPLQPGVAFKNTLAFLKMEHSEN